MKGVDILLGVPWVQEHNPQYGGMSEVAFEGEGEVLVIDGEDTYRLQAIELPEWQPDPSDGKESELDGGAGSDLSTASRETTATQGTKPDQDGDDDSAVEEKLSSKGQRMQAGAVKEQHKERETPPGVFYEELGLIRSIREEIDKCLPGPLARHDTYVPHLKNNRRIFLDFGEAREWQKIVTEKQQVDSIIRIEVDGKPDDYDRKLKERQLWLAEQSDKWLLQNFIRGKLQLEFFQESHDRDAYLLLLFPKWDYKDRETLKGLVPKVVNNRRKESAQLTVVDSHKYAEKVRAYFERIDKLVSKYVGKYLPEPQIVNPEPTTIVPPVEKVPTNFETNEPIVNVHITVDTPSNIKLLPYDFDNSLWRQQKAVRILKEMLLNSKELRKLLLVVPGAKFLEISTVVQSTLRAMKNSYGISQVRGDGKNPAQPIKDAKELEELGEIVARVMDVPGALDSRLDIVPMG